MFLYYMLSIMATPPHSQTSPRPPKNDRHKIWCDFLFQILIIFIQILIIFSLVYFLVYELW